MSMQNDIVYGQMDKHLNTIQFYSCLNLLCGDKLRTDPRNFVVKTGTIECPRCEHILFWERIYPKEANNRMKIIWDRFNKYKERAALQKQIDIEHPKVRKPRNRKKKKYAV